MWPTIRRWAGKQKDLGSIPLRLSSLFVKLWFVDIILIVTLPLTINENGKMALTAAHLNAGVILVVTV